MENTRMSYQELLNENTSLKEKEELCNNMFDNVTVGMVQTDREGNYIKSNQKFRDITGYSEEELMRLNFTQITHAEDLLEEMEIKKKVDNNEIDSFVMEKRYIRKDGSTIWVKLFTKIIRVSESNSKVKYIFGIVEDISEMKEIIEKLEDSRYKLLEAQKLASFGHWTLDLKKNELQWSDEIYRIFGLKPQEFEANYEAFLSFVHPKDRDYVHSIYSKHVKDRIPYCIIHRLLLKDDRVKYVQEKCRTEYDIYGSPIRSIGTVQDITERIRVEKKLAKSKRKLKKKNKELKIAKRKAEESDRLKTAFLWNISHEVRTPMNGIIGFSEMLAEDDLSKEQRKYYSDLVAGSGRQLLTILDQIIEISKLETGQVEIKDEKFTLESIMGEMTEYYRSVSEKGKIKLETRFGNGISKKLIWGDSHKIRQVLENLLNNAFKFTNEGKILFGYEIKDKRIKFFVKDTGIGIPENMQEKIFQRFVQVESDVCKEYGGAGLGLAIARDLGKLLNGELWCESELGKGSTFYFDIPLIEAEEMEKKETKISKMDFSILVAEDEVINVLYLKELMNTIGVKIIHAKDGFDAIEQCKKHPEIGLALMDIRMPKLNGYEATKRIKAIRPDLPVIAQTAFVQSENETKAKECGFDGYIGKPFGNDEIISVVESFRSRVI